MSENIDQLRRSITMYELWEKRGLEYYETQPEGTTIENTVKVIEFARLMIQERRLELLKELGLANEERLP